MEWKDVNILQYQNLLKELDEKYPDELEKSIGILSCLTGKPIYYYTDEIPVNELREKLKGISFINSKPKPQKLHSKIRIGKYRYRFNLNMRTISAGQYIDLTTYVKSPEKINDNLHLILATLSERINFLGFKVKSTPQDRAKHLQEHMTMPYVFTLSDFFLSNYQKLIKGTVDFLELQTKKAVKKTKEALGQVLSNTGDGITL